MQRIGFVTGMVCGLVAAGAAAQPAADNPYMSFTDEMNWETRYEMVVSSYVQSVGRNQLGATTRFEWEGLTLVAPTIEESGSHLMETGGVQGELSLDGTKIYSAGSQDLPRWEHLSETAGGGMWANAGGYSIWRLPAGRAQTFRSTTTTRVRCFNTQFNEALAEQVDWPKAWPAEALACLQPQLYVNLGEGEPYDMSGVQRLLSKYTSNQDPKGVKPLTLAKWITDRVTNEFRVAGGQRSLRDPRYSGQLYSRAGTITFGPLPGTVGFDVVGAPDAAQRMGGTRFDAAVLLVALFREAGLPSRVVVGWDVGEQIVNRNPERTPGEDEGRFVVWVEFCLYDESLDIMTWVPIDLELLAQNRGRRKLDQPWEYFGSHDHLNSLVPLAFDLHPAAMVQAFGAPCLGGVASIPSLSEIEERSNWRVYQNIEVEVKERSKRGRTVLPGPKGKERGQR